VYCPEHAPAPAPEVPRPAATAPPPVSSISPGLAFVLGLIPGVGAIYNGQYAKGLMHVVVTGILISIMSSGAVGGMEPLVGFMIAGWFFYMPFEAYHTATKRLRGEQVDEYSSLLPLRSRSGFPVGPVVLIALGVVFLLDTLDIVRIYRLFRYWPVFLIALGAYMLYARMFGDQAKPAAPEEAPNEQR
jgi:TM2 domain-containing membrane protein YozV